MSCWPRWGAWCLVAWCAMLGEANAASASVDETMLLTIVVAVIIVLLGVGAVGGALYWVRHHEGDDAFAWLRAKKAYKTTRPPDPERGELVRPRSDDDDSDDGVEIRTIYSGEHEGSPDVRRPRGAGDARPGFGRRPSWTLESRSGAGPPPPPPPPMRRRSSRRAAVETVVVRFEGPTLGVAFRSDGVIKGLMPRGEAEAKGLRVGDKVTAVGGTPVGDSASIQAAVRESAARPLDVVASRPYDAADASAHHSVTFRGETLGLAFEPDGRVKGVRVGDRVTCVGPSPQDASSASILAAVKAHDGRPLTLTVKRDREDLCGHDYFDAQFRGPKLGLAFEADGRVKGVAPGGEAAAEGVRLGDAVTCVGATPTFDEASILDAVKAQRDRPLTLTVKRVKKPAAPEPEDADEDLGPGTDHVTVTIQGERLGLAFTKDGAVAGVAPRGEAEAKGIKRGDRITCVGGIVAGDTDTSLLAAIRMHPARPIVLTIARDRPTPPPATPKAPTSDFATSPFTKMDMEADVDAVGRGDPVAAPPDADVDAPAADDDDEKPPVDADAISPRKTVSESLDGDGLDKALGAPPKFDLPEAMTAIDDDDDPAPPDAPAAPPDAPSAPPEPEPEPEPVEAATPEAPGDDFNMVTIDIQEERFETPKPPEPEPEPKTPAAKAQKRVRDTAKRAYARAQQAQQAAYKAYETSGVKQAVEACGNPDATDVVETPRVYEEAAGEISFNMEVIFLDDEEDVARAEALAEAERRRLANFLPGSTTPADVAAANEARRNSKHLRGDAADGDGDDDRNLPGPHPSTIYAVEIAEAGPMGMALIMRTISGHNVVVVRSVAPGGRADAAGVQVNSRLYSVNGIRISSEKGHDPYAVLGIGKEASTKEVRKNYKKESLKKHPDRPGGKVDDFIELHSAYDILMDDRARKDYDNNAANDDFDKATALIKASSRPLKMVFFYPTGELGKEDS